MSFSSLDLPKYLLKALENVNYAQPYPIQEQAIPAILERKDILGIAQTGSGKNSELRTPDFGEFGNKLTSIRQARERFGARSYAGIGDSSRGCI